MKKYIFLIGIMFVLFLHFCFIKVNGIKQNLPVVSQLQPEFQLGFEQQRIETEDDSENEKLLVEESKVTVRNRVEWDWISDECIFVGDTITMIPSDGMHEGTMRVYIKDCYVLEEDEGWLDVDHWLDYDHFFPDSKGATVLAGEGTRSLFYPDYVQEDGTFMDGIALLVVILEIENIDAYTDDLHFDNQYLFDVRDYELISSKWYHYMESDTDEYRMLLFPDYCSSRYSEEWPNMFIVEPGQKVEITLGYYLDMKNGVSEDLSDIYLLIYSEGHNFRVNLGLTNE